MSRIRVFDLKGVSTFEFEGRISRGWAITGNPSVRGGGQTSVVISTDIAAQPWLQFGRMVLVEQEDLPAWAGVIDPDWSGRAPIGVTIYNTEYLLSLRTPDDPILITGTTAKIAGKMIELLNAQEETFLRLGRTDTDQAREETFDRRTFWEQLQGLIERAGMEMQLRPDVVDGRLIIYMDIAKQLGKDTLFEYKDGQGGNMSVTDCKISKSIWNRVIGINDASSEESRLQTEAFVDAESIRAYRMRSTSVQFQNVTEMSTLRENARNYLAANSRPLIELTVRVKDKGKAFANAALGNSAIFHASNIWLPGGVRGWRGTARMLAIAYDEPTKTLGMTAVGQL